MWGSFTMEWNKRSNYHPNSHHMQGGLVIYKHLEIVYTKENWFEKPLGVAILGTEFPKYLLPVLGTAQLWTPSLVEVTINILFLTSFFFFKLSEGKDGKCISGLIQFVKQVLEWTDPINWWLTMINYKTMIDCDLFCLME